MIRVYPQNRYPDGSAFRRPLLPRREVPRFSPFPAARRKYPDGYGFRVIRVIRFRLQANGNIRVFRSPPPVVVQSKRLKPLAHPGRR